MSDQTSDQSDPPRFPSRLHPTEEERRGFDAERRDDEERERRRARGDWDTPES
jgi:hypothetical protein